MGSTLIEYTIMFLVKMVFHTKNLEKTFFSYSKMGGLPLTISTLSRFEKWVSYVPTGLFVFSGLENRKMASKWVEIVKIR